MSVSLSDYADLSGATRTGFKVGDEATYHGRDGKLYPVVVKSLAYSRPEAPGLVRDCLFIEGLPGDCLFIEGLPDGPNTLLAVDEDRIRPR